MKTFNKPKVKDLKALLNKCNPEAEVWFRVTDLATTTWDFTGLSVLYIDDDNKYIKNKVTEEVFMHTENSYDPDPKFQDVCFDIAINTKRG